MRTLTILALLVACKGPADDSGDTDAEVVDDSADWCDRVLLPEAFVEPDTVLAVADLHAGVRLYGMNPTLADADDALIAAWPTVDPPDLDAYADGLVDACYAEAGGARTTYAPELRGKLAWVRPGSDETAIPAGAEGVVLDLRGSGGFTEADIEAALAPALATDVPRERLTARLWDGYVDQVFAADNVYHVTVTRIERPSIVATGATDLPIFIVDDARMSPAAARIAGDLAVAGRAHIVGHDVLGAVADADAHTVGYWGVAFRASHGPWPDVIAADALTNDPEGFLADVDPADWSAPDPARGEDTRADPPGYSPFEETPAPALTGAALRVDLTIIVGVVRQFWLNGDIDAVSDRYVELIAEQDESEPTPQSATVALGRLGESLHDGHVFFGSYQALPTRYLGVTVDHLANGRPVVVHSATEGLEPGDEIRAVDGVSIDQIYADLLSWNGAASDGYARDLASRQFVKMNDAHTLTVADPDGVQRDETVDPVTLAVYRELPFGPTRTNGALTDLGAPTVLYVNLDASVSTSSSAIRTLIDDDSATGLILDMRGYPGINTYDVIGMLVDGDWMTPQFEVANRAGPRGDGDIVLDQYTLSASDRFDGRPVALLVGPRTVSAAENFSQAITGAGRVHVIGRQSASTNGNICGLSLPGDLYFTLTGMRVRNPDGSLFHGIGIQPDESVAPTAADLRDGRDPEVLAAIDWIAAQGR